MYGHTTLNELDLSDLGNQAALPLFNIYPMVLVVIIVK